MISMGPVDLPEADWGDRDISYQQRTDSKVQAEVMFGGLGVGPVAAVAVSAADGSDGPVHETVLGKDLSEKAKTKAQIESAE